MLSTIIVLIAVAVASFVFRDVIYATGLYFVQYYRHGQAEAENDALDAMGENRVSYGLKGEYRLFVSSPKSLVVDSSFGTKLQVCSIPLNGRIRPTEEEQSRR